MVTVALMGCIASPLGCAADREVPLASFANEAREAICDWAVRCQHNPSRESCERLLDPKDYEDRRARDSIDAGLSQYDPFAASRCIEATRDGLCLEVPFSDRSCAEVFVGTQELGMPCSSVRECRSGRCGIEGCPGQCCVGVCEAASFEPQPEPVASGEACEGHGDCAPAGYCETNRRCARFGTEPGDRCLIGCARGDLYCDIETFRCEPFGALGASCDPRVPGALPCDPAWAVCDGVCRPRPGLGERCNTTDRLCIPSTRCDGPAGVCIARGANGASCETRKDCLRECDAQVGECQTYASCEL